jgi:hypothetical protein
VSFASIILCIASRVFVVVVVYFVIYSVRKLLDTHSYVFMVWYLVKPRYFIYHLMKALFSVSKLRKRISLTQISGDVMGSTAALYSGVSNSNLSPDTCQLE